MPLPRSLLPTNTLRMLPYWTAAAVTGLVAVAFAKVFGLSEEMALHWLARQGAWAYVITPGAMVLSAGLAQQLAPYAAGSGIPQLLAAAELAPHQPSVARKLLGIRVVGVKFLGSCACVAGGGIAGREGPMLQIAAGIFQAVHRAWPRRLPAPDLQSMVLAGGAAGLAAAFNTPLGGVVFAVEELAKVHVSKVRTHVFHAVVIAGLFAQAVLGDYLYLGETRIVAPPAAHVFLIALAGALIGAIGGGFGRALVLLLDWRAGLSGRGKLAVTGLLGVGVAALAQFYGPQAMGAGRHMIIGVLHGAPVAPELGLIRAAGNLLTYAGGVIGGIFAPSLAAGAGLGAWLGGLHPHLDPRLWALAGMAAFLSGVTRSPFTSFILVLEMTASHHAIMPLMLASITAHGAARLVDPVSFYERMSLRILKAHGVEESAAPVA